MFGATGLVGSEALKLALAQGHEVCLLARSAKRVPVTGVNVLVGDAMDPTAVARTVTGCDAVLSSLGGFGDAESIDAGNANIMLAMRDYGIRRLVVMQGFHIPFPGDPRNPGARFIDAMLGLRSRELVARSHHLGELLCTCHDLDWTLVRAPMVKRGGPTGHIDQGVLALGPRSFVTTGDLAEVLLDVLADPASARTAPMVRSAPARRLTPRPDRSPRTASDRSQALHKIADNVIVDNGPGA